MIINIAMMPVKGKEFAYLLMPIFLPKAMLVVFFGWAIVALLGFHPDAHRSIRARDFSPALLKLVFAAANSGKGFNRILTGYTGL